MFRNLTRHFCSVISYFWIIWCLRNYCRLGANSQGCCAKADKERWLARAAIAITWQKQSKWRDHCVDITWRRKEMVLKTSYVYKRSSEKEKVWARKRHHLKIKCLYNQYAPNLSSNNIILVITSSPRCSCRPSRKGGASQHCMLRYVPQLYNRIKIWNGVLHKNLTSKFHCPIFHAASRFTGAGQYYLKETLSIIARVALGLFVPYS